MYVPAGIVPPVKYIPTATVPADTVPTVNVVPVMPEVSIVAAALVVAEIEPRTPGSVEYNADNVVVDSPALAVTLTVGEVVSTAANDAVRVR